MRTASRPLRIDGRLDEEVYRTIAPISDFIQQEPDEGQPATEKTEAWILFDDVNLYICARNWDSHPEREIANELRRDSGNILGNENLTFAIDTLHDRRNGYVFQTNALGALRDMAVTDDQQNQAWNGIWSVKTARFENGWTVEVAIPFKTLRYRGSGPQTWGINLRRLVKWKNEFSYLSLVPAALGTGGISRMASAATVIGLETPAQSKNLELKPYAVASSTTDRGGASPFNNRGDANAGLDFKYGLTRSLIVDATYRTDFAQVEEDVQQINLTRFSVFFPEKRDFFIEGQGIFDFGGVQAGNSPGDVPLLFFSRQIGLSQGQVVPVIGGARLTGRAGAYSIGALNIQTDDKPSARALSTNFSALRLKRNLFRRSNVGVLATRRGPALGSLPGTSASSYTAGADATMLFFSSINITSYYALTSNPGPGGAERDRIELPRTVRLQRRSLRRHRRAHADRRRLQAGGRLRAAHRHSPQLCAGPLQPAAARQPVGSQIHLAGEPRLRDRRGGRRAAEPRGRRVLPDRFPVERSVLRGAFARVRAAAGPVRDRAGGDRAGGRLYLLQHARVVLARPAAPGVRAAERGDRFAVRRHQVARCRTRAGGASSRSSRSSPA